MEKENKEKLNKKVGEETILKFHKDNPNQAPLLGSSSDEDDDGLNGGGGVDGSGSKQVKNWIGVCNARLQHRGVQTPATRTAVQVLPLRQR